MRVLFWYCDRLAWTPIRKTLEDVPDAAPGGESGAVAAFVHVEPQDADRAGKVETKLVKNCKWLCGKWGTQRVVLHSFTHLAEDKGDPDLARGILERAHQRLNDAGYAAVETPYGHFHDLELKAPGHPLARIFKQL